MNVEMSVGFRQAIQHNFPKDKTLYSHCCENLKTKEAAFVGFVESSERQRNVSIIHNSALMRPQEESCHGRQQEDLQFKERQQPLQKQLSAVDELVHQECEIRSLIH
jgi:hypothetical protein